jgi:hypothetical protein
VNSLAKPAYISHMDAAIHALALILMVIGIVSWITRRERAKKPVHPRGQKKKLVGPHPLAGVPTG